MASAPICPYCGGAAELVSGATLFPHREDIRDRRFWECAGCQAWVGCRTPRGANDSECPRPLGTLAEAALRRWRTSAHALIGAMPIASGSLIGIDKLAGQVRTVFGVSNLLDGIAITTLVVGLFAIGKPLYVASRFTGTVTGAGQPQRDPVTVGHMRPT